MFDEHTMVSRQPRVGLRWAAGMAALVQGLFLSAIWLGPMLWPAALPVVSAAPGAVLTVEMHKPDLPKVKTRTIVLKHQVHDLTASASAPVTPGEQHAKISTGGGGVFRPDTGAGPIALGPIGPGMGGGTLPFGFGRAPGAPGVVARAAPAPAGTGPIRISDGVARGLLLSGLRPVYPQIAKAAHQQGTVVITATIDAGGDLTNAQAISGPLLLRQAALDAVRQARYKPYRLNGEPVAVETTISINFTLNS